jgi:hypothetical protein
VTSPRRNDVVAIAGVLVGAPAFIMVGEEVGFPDASGSSLLGYVAAP